MRRPWSPLLAVALSAAVSAAPARPQRPAVPRAPDTALADAPVATDPGSPRATVAAFLAAARAARWDEAGRFLAVDRAPAPDAPRLARRLMAVLDHHLWLEPDALSPLAVGDTADGLARDREVLGEIPLDGQPQPVALTRIHRAGERARWVFGAQTVARIDGWYEALPDAWIRDHLPAPLLATGPLGLLWWQWLAMAVLVPLAVVAGWLLQTVTTRAARHLTARTPTGIDDALVERIRAPVTLLWSLVAARLLLEGLALSLGAERTVGVVLRALGTVAGTWLVLRAVKAVEVAVPASGWGIERPELRHVAPVVSRFARLVVVLFGLIALIAQFGYSVTTLLAGLGIGGIAVAFAAQKTIENLFGSVAIGVDRPIRVGDWVEIDGVEGEVEAIGFRSTRLRTLRNTVVTFPNGKLADMRMENFGARERILFDHTIGLVYGTTEAQLRAVRDGFEAALRAHPLCWPDRVVVRLVRFGASSLDLRCIAWFRTSDINEFRAAQEEVLFRFLAVVAAAGTSIAFPTQTVHLVRGDAGPPPG